MQSWVCFSLFIFDLNQRLSASLCRRILNTRKTKSEKAHRLSFYPPPWASFLSVHPTYIHIFTMGSITAGPTPTKAPAHDGTAPAGALTTVFTPPASCSETAYKWYRTSTCMPSPERWRLYWSAASFYSPGICPSGMVSAATPPAFFGPPVELDETAIVCCPRCGKDMSPFGEEDKTD